MLEDKERKSNAILASRENIAIPLSLINMAGIAGLWQTSPLIDSRWFSFTSGFGFLSLVFIKTFLGKKIYISNVRKNLGESIICYHDRNEFLFLSYEILQFSCSLVFLNLKIYLVKCNVKANHVLQAIEVTVTLSLCYPSSLTRFNERAPCIVCCCQRKGR